VNRLSVRLALAFVGVTLAAVAVVALLADWQAVGEFRQFLGQQAALQQTALAEQLAEYYQRNGRWDGVESLLAAVGPAGRGAGAGRGGPRLLLADADATIIYDPRTGRVGQALTTGERSAAAPIQVDGHVVGYLGFGDLARSAAALSAAEQAFLDRLRMSLWLAALVAGALGIAAGLWLSRTLTAPLARLAVAARAFARRDWTARAAPGDAAELAEVATAFNGMADALREAEALRRNLMADVAHELRTPLSVLQGSLRALLDGVYPLELAEIATLYDETRLLSRLVDDLRELALAEAGQLRLNLEVVPVAPLVESATSLFAAAAQADGVRLDVVASSAQAKVMADPDRLAQVLRNLLANALRHTPAGGRIECRVSSDEGAADGRARVTISVADSGEGIAPEDLPHVFDRFYRGDRSRARQRGGAGLGLAIVKSLVETMGGAIGVQSTPGAGSTFSFWLPAASA
jgi:two-component system OmpR family sensor kinase/two-component system sensor histidine kinase BaeS